MSHKRVELQASSTSSIIKAANLRTMSQCLNGVRNSLQKVSSGCFTHIDAIPCGYFFDPLQSKPFPNDS